MMKNNMIFLLLLVSDHLHAQCNASIVRTAPDGRYETFNNGIEVKDMQTGLIWQRCSLGQTWSGSTCNGAASTSNWLMALQSAKNIAGWRLPNAKELESLVEQACYKPSINEKYFPNTPVNTYYWSSSPVSLYYVDVAWVVSFYSGALYYDNFNGRKDNYYYVRLVR